MSNNHLQVQTQPAPTLSYQRGEPADEAGRTAWATRPERFEAGVADFAVTWIGLFVMGMLVTLVVRDGLLTLTIAAAWLGVHVLADAWFGWTFGRANVGLEVCDRTGSPASRWQIVVRAMVHRLWLWPLLAMLCVATVDSLGLRVHDVAAVVINGAWVLCGLGSLVNIVLVLLGEPNLTDRISRTRLRQIAVPVGQME